MKQKVITLGRNELNMIALVESMGTWEREKFNFDLHNSYDIWSFNGNYYKIWKDSLKAE